MDLQTHSPHALCALFLLLITLLTVSSDSGGAVGINYGRIANDLPSPPQVVQLLQQQGITRAKLFDSEPTVLSAFSGSGISITVALPNEHLSAAAGSQSFTDAWLQSNILPYHPKTLIEAIAVGNEVFADAGNTTRFLVPAMQNLHASLSKYGVASSIKVSSPVALSALETSYPSSSGSFKPDLVEPVIKPMLDFIKKTASYLMVNAYPFFAYTENTDTISLDYALFRNNSGNLDPNNGLVYRSLLDAQIDAVFAAMAKLGFGDVSIVVSETGWPSMGDENEIGASVENAAAYNGNLVRRVLSGDGTPLRPHEPLTVYLFALFNENQKSGPTSERNYGLFYPNEQKVYDISLTVVGGLSDEMMANGSNSQVAAAPSAQPPRDGGAGGTWCVANEKAGEAKLQAALDYACGPGGAECRPIRDPTTLVGHASCAFNSYYQKNEKRGGTCYFGGAAYVVTQRPNFISCDG